MCVLSLTFRVLAFADHVPVHAEKPTTHYRKGNLPVSTIRPLKRAHIFYDFLRGHLTCSQQWKKVSVDVCLYLSYDSQKEGVCFFVCRACSVHIPIMSLFTSRERIRGDTHNTNEPAITQLLFKMIHMRIIHPGMTTVSGLGTIIPDTCMMYFSGNIPHHVLNQSCVVSSVLCLVKITRSIVDRFTRTVLTSLDTRGMPWLTHFI